MYDLIAILGRGIQKDKSAWSLTEEIEVCDKNSAHLIDRVSPDDENPCSMIGGGELNLIAGKILIENQDIKPPKIVVCAYGHRAQYLEDADAPTESEVMSEQLKPFIPEETELLVWDKHRYPKPLVPSNTRQEMLNVLDLALEKKCSRVAFIAIGVHVPRAATYLAKHLSVYEKYRVLNPVVLETEEILLANRVKYSSLVEKIRSSKSFARNWVREADGIQKIIRDVYGDAKPNIKM
jgi:hypothetical protein